MQFAVPVGFICLTCLFSPADEEGPEGLTQFLMTEVRRLREARKSQLQREQQLQARGRLLEEERARLEQRLREQQQAQERCQRLREDWEVGNLELLRLKEENYMIAMRLAQLSEEKNSAILRSRDLQLAVGPGSGEGANFEKTTVIGSPAPIPEPPSAGSWTVGESFHHLVPQFSHL